MSGSAAVSDRSYGLRARNTHMRTTDEERSPAAETARRRQRGSDGTAADAWMRAWFILQGC